MKLCAIFKRRSAGKPIIWRYLQSVLIVGLLCTHNAYSKGEVEEPQWYQINVLIFERLTSGGPGMDEAWPKDKLLLYPTNIQYLKPLEKTDSETTFSEEEPFTLLPEQLRELAYAEEKFKRSRKYRVLFHESWRQPVYDFDKSASIIIQGGDKYDDHYELKGTIKFSVSRYLHASADLWLTEFETNYGQPTGQWPELPLAPRKLSESEFTHQEALKLNLSRASDEANQTSSGIIDLKADRNTDNDTINRQINSTLTTNKKTFYGDERYSNFESFNQTNPLTAIDKQHITKTIITLQQTRRMRSDETHYIDHPKLGVIIRISPYEKPLPVEPEPEPKVQKDLLPRPQPATKKDIDLIPKDWKTP